MVDITDFNIDDAFIRNSDCEVLKLTSIDRSYYPKVWLVLKGPISTMSIISSDLQHFVKYDFLTPVKNNQCDHEWKSYVGFTECFKYCTKCNEKDKL